ncbi:hypothetical protein UYO_1682 [Lachnospiraceae bacterium JC7]|nr:hypothetical protein UYO_1682 [Lachnospiraceae bacterium JC7]
MTNYISLQNSMVEMDNEICAEIKTGDNAALRLKNRRLAMSKVRRYLISTIATALFGAIYEYFSFGVFSYYMLYAFSFPLVFGLLPWFMIAMDNRSFIGAGFPQQMTCNLWGAGITTLTVGAVFHGALDIYGTTNALSKYYFIVGALLLLIAVMAFIGSKEKRETRGRI